MWLMLQADKPEDFVIATGETHSVREFIELSFKSYRKTIEWEGTGVNEIGKDKDTGEVHIKINPKFYRPTEVELLLGDPTKAVNQLKWEKKYSFPVSIYFNIFYNLYHLEICI